MKTIGIVAEYNPFHLGHDYHLRESRRLSGGDAAVAVVMSGDFVQRGEAAVFSKYARAEAACRCGADLVVELPLPWCLASAEGFAEGAVQLLAALGTDVISFGSETADLEELEELSAVLTQSDFLEETLLLLKEDPAQNYASARQKAAEKRFGRPLPVLRQPNNILALEYLNAIRRNSFNIKPLAVVRKGAGHDEIEAEKDILSASELRRRLRAGENAGTLLPKEAAAVFDRETKEGRTALDKERQELLMLARLRFLEKEDFDALPDAGDGFGERLWTAVQKAASYEEVLNTAATRRFPMARARRCCLAAVLGLRDGYKKGNVPYARVLAFRERGRMLLREAGDLGRIQLLTKAAHSLALDERGRQIFCLGARAHDFYTLSYQKEEARVCGEDWRKGPFICI